MITTKDVLLAFMCKDCDGLPGGDCRDCLAYSLVDGCCKALERENADGCKDCKWDYKSQYDQPCLQCRRNHEDKWEARK